MNQPWALDCFFSGPWPLSLPSWEWPPASSPWSTELPTVGPGAGQGSAASSRRPRAWPSGRMGADEVNRGGGGGQGDLVSRGEGACSPPQLDGMLRERPALAGQGPQPPCGAPLWSVSISVWLWAGRVRSHSTAAMSTLLCTVVLSRLTALAWSLLRLVVRPAVGTSRLSPRGGAMPSRGTALCKQRAACSLSSRRPGPLQEPAWSVPCWPSGAGSRRGSLWLQVGPRAGHHLRGSRTETEGGKLVS